MQKFLLYMVCAVCPLLLSWKEPDYRQTCDFVYEHLDEHAKAGLNSLLGKRTLAYYATHMGRAVKDSIENYAGPLNKLELGGPYRYSELDSALRPLNLQILRGIKKYNQELLNTNLPQNRRMFALQVLIGLHTAMQLPLQGVTHLLPRSELLAHDIFENVETPKYGKVSLITLLLYDSYKLGVRVRQADGDGRIIQSFMETGYRNAGRMLAGSIKEAFAPKGLVEMGEGPDWGKLIEPGKDPIYLFAATPGFPGGYQAFDRFLFAHLHYPDQEWRKGIQGRTYIQIVVEKDGSLSHIQVVSPVSPGIDSEAVRVIRSSPKWLPGHLTIDGPPVRARWICIVNFRILPGYNRENAFNIVIRDNIKPAFSGGKAAFDNYIRSNASYAGPPYGRVTVHYQVEKTGEVKNIKILRSLSPAADAEAIRLLEQSPPWEPGLLNGTYKSMMGDTLSVWFKLR